MTDKERAVIEAALIRARGDMEGWAAYGGQYFIDKHDLSADLASIDAALAALRAAPDGWQPIETAPPEIKDGRKVLVWHDHESDPYYEPELLFQLTIYGAHCDGLTVEQQAGPYIAQFGGQFYDEVDGFIPAWWFKSDSDWDEPLAPTHYRLISPPGESE